MIFAHSPEENHIFFFRCFTKPGMACAKRSM